MTSLARRLADLPIRSRIAIACLIPLIAFTGFAGKAMLEKRVQSQAADSVSALVEVAPLISGLVHELHGIDSDAEDSGLVICGAG